MHYENSPMKYTAAETETALDRKPGREVFIYLNHLALAGTLTHQCTGISLVSLFCAMK